MATLCISAISSGEVGRRARLLSLIKNLTKSDEKVAVLLYGDGVYNLLSGSRSADELAGAPVEIYAISEDVENRGLKGRVIAGAQQIDYTKAVELVMASEHTVTGL